MVRLRLTRKGAKKSPFYRIVATDSRNPRDGRFLEILGYYDPTKNPEILHVRHDRVDHWLGVGAQASFTVKSLLRRWKKSQPAEGQPAEGQPAEGQPAEGQVQA